MSSISEFKSLGDGLPFAALRCNIREDNSAKRECFTACWEDLIMVTRTASRTVLTEDSSTGREHYDQNHQLTFMVQSSPEQRMRMGRLGQKALEYQLPYKNVLPVPVFIPSKIISVAKEDFEAESSLMPEEFERILIPKCIDKQQGSEINKELTCEIGDTSWAITSELQAAYREGPKMVLVNSSGRHQWEHNQKKVEHRKWNGITERKVCLYATD